MATAPSASYSLLLQLRLSDPTAQLAAVLAAVTEAGGALAGEPPASGSAVTLTVNASSLAGAKAIAAAVRAAPGVTVEAIEDRTFMLHDGGKMVVASKAPLTSKDDLSMAYTPGVARVCMAVHDDPMLAYRLTIRGNTVAVVSDGTAVLGLGDIGPLGAMPVMEGKAILFKEFGGVDAFPVCLSTKDTEEIIATVKAIAPTFGGINLEDISAPRCFEIDPAHHVGPPGGPPRPDGATAEHLRRHLVDAHRGHYQPGHPYLRVRPPGLRRELEISPGRGHPRPHARGDFRAGASRHRRWEPGADAGA